MWPQALVCAQRSAQSQDSSLHIPPGTQAEPPEVLTHPLPVPLASKEHPTRHWQTPVHESSAAGTEKTGLKGELTQGGPLSPEPSPLSTQDHWRRGGWTWKDKGLGDRQLQNMAYRGEQPLLPRSPRTLWPQIYLGFHRDRTRASPTCLPHL